jgi:hypothetical protein
MALDLLKGAAQGVVGRGLRKVAGNLPGLLGLNKGRGGNSSDTASLESTKYTTKAYSFPGDVAAQPGTGNQGHYIMFFINQQQNAKLGFGGEKLGAGQKSMEEESSRTKKEKTKVKAQLNTDFIDDAASSNVRKTENKFKYSSKKGSTLSVPRPPTVRLDTAITLYMPQMVAFTTSAQYQDEVVGDAAAAGANVYQEILNGQKSGLDIAKDAMKRLGKDIGEGMINKGIGALSIIPGIEGAKDVFFAQRGFIKAPKMELFFKGIGKRKFQYTFKMTPRNDAEMQEIRKIVQAFRLNMLPEFEDGDRASRRLTIPNTFDIQYMYNGKVNQYLHKISTCVLESCDVKFSGEGKYQTFTADDDGAPPTVTEMSLNFQEMEIITKERVAEGY